MIRQPHQTHQPDELLHDRPDDLIDRALHSLRDTQAPTGLEARVAARLAQATEAHSVSSSNRASSRSPFANTATPAQFFAVILERAQRTKDPRILLAEVPLYALSAAALLTASFFAFHHHNVNTIAPSTTQPIASSNQPSIPARASGLATTRVPQGFSLGSHKPLEKAAALAPAPTDLDVLALAETLAPSHPAPHMPLTTQEHLLILATRQGQPIEVAELDLARQPALQAVAEAHQQTRIRNYIQGLLGPLAVAETIQPTSPSPSLDDGLTSQPPSK